VPPGRVSRISIPIRRFATRRAGTRRRLAVVDSHFPWTVSGFRYHEGEEFLRRRPDTLFFSLYEMTDPFPTRVYPLAEFPTRAAAAGVTDVYMVFFNWAAGILGVAGPDGFREIAGAREDISLLPAMTRWGMRAHVTIYPGGGLFPDTPKSAVEEIARRSATIFTTVDEVAEVVPNAIRTTVPVPGDFYGFRSRRLTRRPRLVFVGDDRPRKGLGTLLDAMELAGCDYELDVVGPHERHLDRLVRLGARLHGWLEPEELRKVLWECDVVVAPATVDRPEDGYGDTGVIDGFPTTAARVAMLTGCCLVGSNPSADTSLLQPGLHYLEFPERDPAGLAHVLQQLATDDDLRARIATAGAEMLRSQCDVGRVVVAKLEHMGLAAGQSHEVRPSS
jgi:glycosyltransferase involved in cell wall biosynthesis